MSTIDEVPEATRIRLETTVTVAMFIGGMAWAANIAVAVRCLWVILRKRDRSVYRWLWLIIPLIGCATMNLLGLYNYYVLSFIKERSYLGGPLAFWAQNLTHSSAMASFVGGLLAFVLSYACMLYLYYSLLPTNWFVRLVTVCLLVAICILAPAGEIEEFVKRVATPPSLEDALSISNVPFANFYQSIPLAINSGSIALMRVYGKDQPATLQDQDPQKKLLLLQYSVIAVATLPLAILGIMAIVASMSAFAFTGARRDVVQFVYAVVAVQLAALCTEVLVSWMVEPPDEVRDAMRNASIARDNLVFPSTVIWVGSSTD